MTVPSRSSGTTVVDIGVACGGAQNKEWWSVVMGMLLQETQRGITIGAIRTVGSAVPDYNKNNILTSQKKRLSLTDANRVEITTGFLQHDAEWLFQMDDDTIPPYDVITQLVNKGREFIAGVYFLPISPYNPIAYIRNQDGTYYPFYNYPKGALVQVDSVGMGCTLIHRSVFEKIRDNHTVFVRPNGSQVAVYNPLILNDKPYKGSHKQGYVNDGCYHLPVTRQDPEDGRSFPFYALEYGRTEDHHFCELAANVGIRPWLDTTVTCKHIKPLAAGEAEYDREVAKQYEGA